MASKYFKKFFWNFTNPSNKKNSGKTMSFGARIVLLTKNFTVA